jgi:omega-hydroxy-beta-dihydromenaquinone-9 sulfotransferase
MYHTSATGRLVDPVFIIGGSRTGSEMLKSILSASPELNLTNEMYALCPRWLHRDLRVDLRRNVDLHSAHALDDTIDLIYSGKLYGWTWRHAETELDRQSMREEMARRPITVESIVTAALRVNARLRNKPRQGAKFPVHYGYAERLLQWYPNCRIIHTTRDPRAVYASQANKYVSGRDNLSKRTAIKVAQFAHINIQVAWTARVHARLLGQAPERYRLVRYEDVVLDPERELRELCHFLEIDFCPSMLGPRRYGSTFDRTKGQRGVKRDSLDAWRRHVSPTTSALIRTLQRGAAMALGYNLARDP